MLKPGYGYEDFLCSECGSAQADEQGCMECGAGRSIRASLGPAAISEHELRQIQLRALFLRRHIKRHTRWSPAVDFLNKIILLATPAGQDLPEINEAARGDKLNSGKDDQDRLAGLRRVWTDKRGRRWTRCPHCKRKVSDAKLTEHIWREHRHDVQ